MTKDSRHPSEAAQPDEPDEPDKPHKQASLAVPLSIGTLYLRRAKLRDVFDAVLDENATCDPTQAAGARLLRRLLSRDAALASKNHVAHLSDADFAALTPADIEQAVTTAALHHGLTLGAEPDPLARLVVAFSSRVHSGIRAATDRVAALSPATRAMYDDSAIQVGRLRRHLDRLSVGPKTDLRPDFLRRAQSLEPSLRRRGEYVAPADHAAPASPAVSTEYAGQGAKQATHATQRTLEAAETSARLLGEMRDLSRQSARVLSSVSDTVLHASAEFMAHSEQARAQMAEDAQHAAKTIRQGSLSLRLAVMALAASLVLGVAQMRMSYVDQKNSDAQQARIEQLLRRQLESSAAASAALREDNARLREHLLRAPPPALPTAASSASSPKDAPKAAGTTR